jgi:hypothetical protein
MPFVLPIPLPEFLVSERRVIPKHDFMHRHLTVAFGPDGRGYVHSELFYNYKRYDQGQGDISAQLVTLLAPEFSITGQLWLFLCKVPKGQLEKLRGDWAEQLVVGG